MIGRLLLPMVVKTLIGAYPRWSQLHSVALEYTPQRIYFANHASHLDTVALWAALPPRLRAFTRPVAALDYWSTGAVRRYIARVLNVVMINRQGGESDPLEPLHAALGDGYSLIIFPEGTRNESTEVLPFKSGLYHLAQQHPHVELVPVYLDNARRSLPKGQFIPVPLTCLVRFGAPIQLERGEDKTQFLSRARMAVLGLQPEVV